MRGIITPEGLVRTALLHHTQRFIDGCMVKMTSWMRKTETGKRLKAQLLEHAGYASRPKMAGEEVKLLAYVASRTGTNVDGRDFGISYHLIRNRFRGGGLAMRVIRDLGDNTSKTADGRASSYS